MNVLRVLRGVSNIAFRNSQQLPVFSSSRRTFAAVQKKDVRHIVVDEDDEDDDVSNIKVPFLRDETRQEMFAKYMQDQEQWSFQNLSVQYGTSLIRTKAVILLMQRRHEMITRDEKKLWKLLDEEAPAVESKNGELILRTQLNMSVPPLLSALFSKHLQDLAVPLSVLISAHNDAISEETGGGQRASISEKDLKAAFSIIGRHAQRRENTEAVAADLEEDLEECREAEIDVNTFRESPTQFTTSKAHNYQNRAPKHIRRSFQDTYFPNLQNDAGVKREELKLLKRIEAETKAQLQHDVEFYERTYAPKLPSERLAEARSAPLPPALQHHQPARAGAPMSRFKLAFQDLSTSAVPLSKKGLRVPDRTVMRTRSGELRYATPLEESVMSWRVRPAGLDRGLANHLPHSRVKLIEPYLDCDGDDQAAAELVGARRERRKAQFAAAGVAK